MIWVLAELRGETIAPVTYEALEAGRVLSDPLETELNLILLGNNLGGLAGGLLKKADRVYLLEHKLLTHYTNDGYIKALEGFLQDKPVRVFLIPGTSTGYEKHYRVKHGDNEFANDKGHINGIESFWSYSKRWLQKFHGVPKNTFYLHLKECEFYAMLLKMIRQNPLF